MTSILISEIQGTGEYAVPTSDAETKLATTGLSSILQGVSGLGFDSVAAFARLNDAGTALILNCVVANALWNGDIAPSAGDLTTMRAAIETALVADPDITAATVETLDSNANSGDLPRCFLSCDNVEFMSFGNFPGPFSVYDLTSGVAASFDGGTPNFFEVSAGLRASSGFSTKEGWGVFQPEPSSPEYAVFKKYGFPGDMNHVMISRCKFNALKSPVADDGCIGIGAFCQSSEALDDDNFIAVFLNETSASGLQASLVSVIAGVRTTVESSTAIAGEGQPFELVALQLRSGYFHAWVGTASGGWLYLGSVAQPAGFIPYFHGFILKNGASSSPGSSLVSVNFLRFYPGESNFIF